MSPNPLHRSSRLLANLLACSALIFAGMTAHAQVTFTFNVTAIDTSTFPFPSNNTAALGYTIGNTYTFTFVTGPSFASNGSSAFHDYQNYWSEETTAHDQLFVSVTGSGLAGSFTRPTELLNEETVSPDPSSNIETQKDYAFNGSNNDALWLNAKADRSNIGLTTIVGSSIVKSITVRLDSAQTFFAYPEVYREPTAFFQAFNGTFNPSSPWGDYRDQKLTIGTTNDGNAYFRVDSVTISTPIPEPSTYAALFGVAALGYVCLRRRRS